MKKLLNIKMCVLIFCPSFIWNISHSKRNRVRCYHKCSTGLHVKYPLFWSDFNVTWIFSIDFLKILIYKFSWKSVKWELSCSMWMDGWTDRQAWQSFPQFCEHAKNWTDVHVPRTIGTLVCTCRGTALLLSIIVRDATVSSLFIYCEVTLHVSGVVAPIVRST